MSYNAVIAKLENVRNHPDADRLNLATCLGYQVVVGLDAAEGTLMVLFPDDGQLSEEYAKANDLVGYTDESGTRKGGYFDAKRRVRAQTFRGEKSEAYVAGVASLAFTGVDVSTLGEGVRFSEINGIPICNKYVTPATIAAAKANQPKQPKLNQDLKRMFPEHLETDQLRHARPEELRGMVTLTHKLHGTSARSALLRIPVEQPQGFFSKLFRRKPVVQEEWKSVFGTRRVIKGEITDKHTDFRAECHRLLQPYIQKGEIWYYEIVGYEETGAPIMQPVSTEKMPKEFRKRFAKTLVYKYGCLPGRCDIFVYRIAVTNDEGCLYELPWGLVKDRCRKAGVKHVPEIGTLIIGDLAEVELLKQEVETMTDDHDAAEPLDPSHVREGVCVRVDCLHSGKMRIFKNKTFIFKVLEGIIKDSGAVDTEELESI